MKNQFVDDEIIAIINSIVAQQLESLKVIAKEKDQSTDDVYAKVIVEIKNQIKMSLDNLYKLYELYIQNDECNLATVLEYIPFFVVYGLWFGAQLGVSQEEFYAIVDQYLKNFNLLEE